MKRQNYLNAIVATLAILAAALSAFLLSKSLSDSAIPGCGAGSACDTVLSSRFSRIGPIPVSLLALPIFLMMAMVSLAASSDDSHRRAHFLQRQFPLAIIAAGAAIWFISVQAFILHQFCTYCTITHALALAASILVFWQWSKSQIKTSPLFPALAAALVLSMIAIQLLVQPKLYTITQATQPSAPPTTNELQLFNNRITINPNDWPILGSRSAQHVVILLFDYTCPHCRREYPFLQQARQRYGIQIAFIAIPVPLEPACNPAIPRIIPEHINSCTYTRYALAVLLADPSRFEEYHNRIMEGEKPPSLEQTRQIAEQLVTPRSFAAALADASIERHIQQSVQIYRDAGASQIPKLILPTAIIHGEIYPLQHMFDVLESYLDLKPVR